MNNIPVKYLVLDRKLIKQVSKTPEEIMILIELYYFQFSEKSLNFLTNIRLFFTQFLLNSSFL